MQAKLLQPLARCAPGSLYTARADGKLPPQEGHSYKSDMLLFLRVFVSVTDRPLIARNLCLMLRVSVPTT